MIFTFSLSGGGLSTRDDHENTAQLSHRLPNLLPWLEKSSSALPSPFFKTLQPQALPWRSAYSFSSPKTLLKRRSTSLWLAPVTTSNRLHKTRPTILRHNNQLSIGGSLPSMATIPTRSGNHHLQNYRSGIGETGSLWQPLLAAPALVSTHWRNDT